MRGLVACLALLTSGCNVVWGLEGELVTDASAADSDRMDTASTLECDQLPEFTVTMESAPGHTYWLMRSGPSVAEYVQQCNDASSGRTHLFAPATLENVLQMTGELQAAQTGVRGMLAGIVQNPTAISNSDAWFTIVGEPVAVAWWAPGQPDDADGDEADHAEQLGGFRSDLLGLIDDDNEGYDGAICECDSRAVDADVVANLAMYD
jgi:hypothetical protein